MRRLFFLLAFSSLVSLLRAQETVFAHPVIKKDYVLSHRIDDVHISDTLSPCVASFTARYQYLDFDFEGLLMKSIVLYDSLPPTREMWYLYYNDRLDLIRQEARTFSDTVTAVYHLQYDGKTNLLTQMTLQTADEKGRILSEKPTHYLWEGDSIRYEHNVYANSFEIIKYRKNKQIAAVIGKYQHIFDPQNRITETLDTDGNATKQQNKSQYTYNEQGQLTTILTNGKWLTQFFYDAKGLLMSEIQTDLQTNLMLHRLTYRYTLH